MQESEFLTSNELAEITGYKHPGSQREWLDANGWQYVLNAARRPIVGRYFARLRLAGVQPTANGGTAAAWSPDFDLLTQPKRTVKKNAAQMAADMRRRGAYSVPA